MDGGLGDAHAWGKASLSDDLEDALNRAIARAIREMATWLDLSLGSGANRITAALAEAAPQLRHVEQLKIGRCALEAKDVEVLGRAMRHLTSLTSLDLGNNALGSEGLAELGRYTDRMRGLKTLGVYENSIGPVGLTAFMRTAENLERLESLDLAGNQVGDEGARILASSAEKLRSLRQLLLHNCGIGDVGTEHLIAALHRATWRNSLMDIGFAENPVSWKYQALCYEHAPNRWREYDPTADGVVRRGLNLELKSALRQLIKEGETHFDGDDSTLQGELPVVQASDGEMFEYAGLIVRPGRSVQAKCDPAINVPLGEWLTHRLFVELARAKGRVRTARDLADVLWPNEDKPPKDAQNAVSKLRTWLGTTRLNRCVRVTKAERGIPHYKLEAVEPAKRKRMTK